MDVSLCWTANIGGFLWKSSWEIITFEFVLTSSAEPFLSNPSFLHSLYIYIYILNRPISIMVRVFTNCPENQGSVPGRVIPKSQECNLMLPCLTLCIIKYGSRVSEAIQEKELPLPYTEPLKREPLGRSRIRPAK